MNIATNPAVKKIPKNSPIGRVRLDIERARGRSVRLKTIGGRRRVAPKTGVIDGAYGNIFTVRLENGGRVSYSYADVLTGSIEITLV